MSYQEKFEITENNIAYLGTTFDILITGVLEEENPRHTNFKNKLITFSGSIIVLNTCENAETLDYTIEDTSGNVVDNKSNLTLIPGLENLLKSKQVDTSKVCIDITNLKQGILFLLINLLINKVKPARLFASYTEPKEYKKKEKFGIGETEEYDLYRELIGSSNPVPGFTKPQTSRDILLLAPIGFDSQRLQTMYENLKPKRIIPIVGFPSFIPGWNLTAIKMNYLILKDADCYDDVISCESASPFKLYDLLKEEFHRNNRNYDVYISPLGTRPHCLGAALFVSKNRSCYLVYDFPVEKKYRSHNILKTNFYDISKYIE